MMDSVVLVIIGMMIVVGLWGAACAIWGVRREGRLLKEPAALRKAILGSSAHFSMRMTSFERWLNENRGAKDASREARVGDGRHLLLRLVTIYESISHNEEARVIPSLHDLHALSLQDEMSRWSSTFLRMVTSVLLVVGILGTLLGVHTVLARPEIDLVDLRDALIPSMLAVFSTVVLMWFRGWYMALLDSYLEKLDLFTMTDIIPQLQPVSRVGSEATDLNIQVTNMKGKIEQVQKMAASMQKFSDEVHASANRLASVFEKMKDVQPRILSDYNEVSKALDASEDRFVQIRDALRAGEGAGKALSGKIQELHAQGMGVVERCREAEGQYLSMTRHLTALTGEINDTKGVIGKLADYADQMLAVGKQVSGYGEGLSRIHSEMQRVEDALAAMETLKMRIEGSANTVYNSATIASETLAKTESCVKEFNTCHADFSAEISKGNHAVTSALEHLKGQVALLKEESGKLHDLFEKRSRKLHIK